MSLRALPKFDLEPKWPFVYDAVDLIIFGRSRGENDFRIFVRSFRWFLRFFICSKNFQILVRGDAIDLVRKSSESELS